MDKSIASSDEKAVVIVDGPDERAGDEFLDELNDESPSVDDSKSNAEDEIKHARRLAQPRLHTIEFMHETAIKRGGKCLSLIYKGLNEKLEWQCCDGHVWETNPRNVLHHNSWCPTCRGNVGEELVRAAFIEAFGKPFERTRREGWLDRLELDGYNPELKLAFEYQGIQHFERSMHFQREEGQFESQLARDAHKRECCKQAGVILLEVSYKIKLNDVRLVVRKMLVDLKFTIADAIMTNDAFYNVSRAGSHNNTRLELAKKIAIEKGGVCLATKYISYDFKMLFRCGQNHEFNASLQDINQDRSRGPRFCPECGGTQKKSDDDIRARVEAIGYRFISVCSEISGGKNRRRIMVQCSANHDSYKVNMDNLTNGDGSLKKGCKKCGSIATGKSKRVDLDPWAEKTGIRPISEYAIRSKKCTWKCAFGHTFGARFDSLQTKKDPCSACWLVYYAVQRNFEIMSDIQNDVKKGDSIKWKCLGCNIFTIDASRVSVSKKDITCKICK